MEAQRYRGGFIFEQNMGSRILEPTQKKRPEKFPGRSYHQLFYILFAVAVSRTAKSPIPAFLPCLSV
jgi:hypothetical protein